jgi:hypothetical protein
MYSSSNIIPSVKSRKMRWAGHVAHMGRTETRAGLWWGNSKERDNLQIQGIVGRVILKDIKQWGGGCGLDSSGSIQRRVAGSFEQNGGPSGHVT